MENKEKLQKGLQLNREEQIKNIPVGMLRSHGKFKGIDVFSWFKANLYELENTLTSFPFPVIWMTNSAQVNELYACSKDWISNVKMLCVYDDNSFNLPFEVLDKVDFICGAKNVNEAFSMFDSLHFSKGILLFTNNESYWFERKLEFEEILK